MNKKIENISLGTATLFVLFVIGSLGVRFINVVIRKILEIGLTKIITFGVIGIVGLLILSVSLLVVYSVGDSVNKAISKRC